MKYILFAATLLISISAMAQPGITEMQQARQDLAGSFFSSLDFSFVVAGLIGITGAVKIYYSWQMGNERIHIQIAGWFFAAIFVILAGAFVRALFGI